VRDLLIAKQIETNDSRARQAKDQALYYLSLNKYEESLFGIIVWRSPVTAIFDFCISYKRRDSESFVAKLTAELKVRQYDVWLDNQEILPGESILASIENGMKSSIDAVVVLSRNYFDGWSEYERRAIFGLMTSKKLRIVPIWYQLDFSDIQCSAPMFADIKAISVPDDTDSHVMATCDSIATSYRPEQRRSRLFELFFRCLSPNFPEDWDLKLFLAVIDNDLELAKKACDSGADVSITDAALWNRYNRLAFDCGCFDEWRKLFLYLSECGEIGGV